MKEKYTDITELDVDLKLEILNKLNSLKNTIEVTSFFSLVNMLIVVTYILTKGF